MCINFMVCMLLTSLLVAAHETNNKSKGRPNRMINASRLCVPRCLGRKHLNAKFSQRPHQNMPSILLPLPFGSRDHGTISWLLTANRIDQQFVGHVAVERSCCLCASLLMLHMCFCRCCCCYCCPSHIYDIFN